MFEIGIFVVSLSTLLYLVYIFNIFLDDLKLKKFIKQLPDEPFGISETIALGKKCGFKIDIGDIYSLKRFYEKLLFSMDIEVIVDSTLLNRLITIKKCKECHLDDPRYLQALVLYILREEYPSANSLIHVKRRHDRREFDNLTVEDIQK